MKVAGVGGRTINDVNVQTGVILTDFTDNKSHLWKRILSLCVPCLPRVLSQSYSEEKKILVSRRWNSVIGSLEISVNVKVE